MSLTLDGKTLDELGLALLEDHQHPVAPPTRDYTVSIPGMDGEHDFGADLGPLPFTLSLLVKPQPNRTLLAAKVRDVMKVFFDAYGKPKTMKLIYDYEPDKYYNVRYSGSLDPSRFKTMAKLVFPVTAFDPWAYALSTAYDKDLQYDSGVQYDQGLIYPNPTSFNWLYPQHYSGVYNYSQFITPLKLIIKGACINPKITNLNTGNWIQISDTFVSTDELIIDSKTFTVVKNGTINLLGKYTSNVKEFVQLIEGDNGFMFESDSTPNAVVIFDWQHKFR